MARENRLVAVESLAPPSHAGRLHLTESASRRANTRGGATAVRKNVAATTIAPPATYRCVGSSRMKAPPPTWAKATAGQAAATAVETIRHSRDPRTRRRLAESCRRRPQSDGPDDRAGRRVHLVSDLGVFIDVPVTTHSTGMRIHPARDV